MNTTKRQQQTPSLPFEEHADNINACYVAPVDSVRKTSIACCEANAAIRSPVARKRLLAILPFNATTFYRYAKIGADQRLMDPGRRHLWTAKMRPMYELHRMTDEEFEAFEAEARWTARLRSVDVIRWKRERLGPELSGAFYAALRPKRSLAVTEMSRADAALSTLAEQLEMDVVYPNLKSNIGSHDKVIRLMRSKARKVVTEDMKQRRKKPGIRLLKPELRKYAGFLADEVEIEADADEERILEVLTALGRVDEFETIRKEAYENFPDGPDGPEWMETVSDKPPPPAALAADEEEIRQQLKYLKPRSAADRKKILANVK
jgi:hypothetical protein